jgi:hypothetical protein
MNEEIMIDADNYILINPDENNIEYFRYKIARTSTTLTYDMFHTLDYYQYPVWGNSPLWKTNETCSMRNLIVLTDKRVEIDKPKQLRKDMFLGGLVFTHEVARPYEEMSYEFSSYEYVVNILTGFSLDSNKFVLLTDYLKTFNMPIVASTQIISGNFNGFTRTKNYYINAEMKNLYYMRE